MCDRNILWSCSIKNKFVYDVFYEISEEYYLSKYLGLAECG